MSAAEQLAKKGWTSIDCTDYVLPQNIIDIHLLIDSALQQKRRWKSQQEFNSAEIEELNGAVSEKYRELRSSVQKHMQESGLFSVVQTPWCLSQSNKFVLLRNKQVNGAVTPLHTDSFALADLGATKYVEADYEGVDWKDGDFVLQNVLMQCPFGTVWMPISPLRRAYSSLLEVWTGKHFDGMVIPGNGSETSDAENFCAVFSAAELAEMYPTHSFDAVQRVKYAFVMGTLPHQASAQRGVKKWIRRSLDWRVLALPRLEHWNLFINWDHDSVEMELVAFSQKVLSHFHKLIQHSACGDVIVIDSHLQAPGGYNIFDFKEEFLILFLN